jgi:hypothetical protein
MVRPSRRAKPGLGIAWDFDAIERMTVEGSHSIHL